MKRAERIGSRPRPSRCERVGAFPRPSSMRLAGLALTSLGRRVGRRLACMDAAIARHFEAWNEPDPAERVAERAPDGRLRRVLMFHGPLPAAE